MNSVSDIMMRSRWSSICQTSLFKFSRNTSCAPDYESERKIRIQRSWSARMCWARACEKISNSEQICKNVLGQSVRETVKFWTLLTLQWETWRSGLERFLFSMGSLIVWNIPDFRLSLCSAPSMVEQIPPFPLIRETLERLNTSSFNLRSYIILV